MVVLKKISASTLMETLVASTLVVIIFIVASVTLNNLFFNTIHNDTSQVEAYLNEIEYLYRNEKLHLPYNDSFGIWDISVEQINDLEIIVIDASNLRTNKSITKNIYVNP